MSRIFATGGGGSGGGGSGTVTSVSVTTVNGISGSVANPTTTPAISLTLGNITPTTVNGLTFASQAVGFTVAGGTISKTLTVPLDASVSGTNTGDQTNISGNAATVTTNANLTGPITSVGNATSIASQTGTGTKFVVDTSPTLITPTLGVASATSLAVAGTAGAGFLTLVGQSSNPSSPAAGTLLIHSKTVNGFTRMEQDNEAATNLIYGRDNVFICRNDTGGTILKGQAVYTSGTASGVPQITKARANSGTTLPAIGVAMDDILTGTFGQVMYSGVLSFDTTAFSDGNTVFVSTATAGALQSTRPSGTTNIVQRMGTILVSGVAGTGLMLVQTAPALLNIETGTNAATWTGSAIVGTTGTFSTSATLGATAGTTGSLLFKGTTSGIVTIKSLDAAGTYTLTLPPDDGTPNQVLTTDGSGVLTWTTAAGGLSWGSTASGTTADGLTLTLSATSNDAAGALKLIADNTQSNQPVLANLQLGTSGNAMGLLIKGTGGTTAGDAGTGLNHMTVWANVDNSVAKLISIGQNATFAENAYFTANGKHVFTPATNPTNAANYIDYTAPAANGSSVALVGMRMTLGTNTTKNAGIIITSPNMATSTTGSESLMIKLWGNTAGSTATALSIGGETAYTERLIVSVEGRMQFTPNASTTSLFRILGTSITGGANNFQIMDYQTSNVFQGTTSWMFKIFPSNIGNTGATQSITVDQFTFGWGRETGSAASVTNNFNMFVVNRSTRKNGTGTLTESGSVLKLLNANTATNAYTDTVDVLLAIQDTNSTGNLINAQRVAGTSVFKVNGYGDIITTPTIRTTGSPSALSITGAAHTTLTLAEFSDVNLNLARTVNFAAGGGTIATMRSALVQAPTYTATTNALTLTDVATVAITGAPVASTNVTITRNHALWVQGGVTRFDSQYYGTIFGLTDGATIALDWNSGNVQNVTLAGNRTFTFANPRAGARYVIVLAQDATGSRTITWPTIKWAGGSAPTLTTTASKKDVITLIYDGTDYLGSAVLNF